MNKKQKLELTWIGKDEQPKLEPRILIEDPDKSYGDKNTENMLIYGDNLLALKALEQDFTGRIKCIYIDPPYNTGNAFQHYDDSGIEHSVWLNLMKPRIDILRNLLSSDGFFCCQIDDSEGHYLKVLLDEIFFRDNYETSIYVRVRYPDKTLKSDMAYHKEIEHILIYRKKFGAKPNLNIEDQTFEKYKYYVDEIGLGREIVLGGKKVIIFEKEEYKIKINEPTEFGLKEIWATGSILDGNSSGRFFRDYLNGRYEIDGLSVLYKVYGIGDDRYDYRYFTGPQKKTATKGKYFQGIPTKILDSKETKRHNPINNFYDLAGSFGNCRTEGGVEFRSGKKPEKLLEIILKHFSNENDWIIDSFLGSGTTAAVAQKMNRKWIGIELGEHCHTHCIPRLQKVIDGEDQGGISESVNWRGGGGFKYYYLAPSLLNQDEHGNWIISKEYNAQMLAAAMAKNNGFRYQPDESTYWKQGQSTEKDFIFTTTNFLTVEHIDKIHDQMGENESLLICCKSYSKGVESKYSNISVKKIPQLLLGSCEFGKEDYSLNIVSMPKDEDEPEFIPKGVKEEKVKAKKQKKSQEENLFG